MRDDSVTILLVFVAIIIAVMLFPLFRRRESARAKLLHTWMSRSPALDEDAPSLETLDREIRVQRIAGAVGVAALIATLPVLLDLRWAVLPAGWILPFWILVIGHAAARVALMGREAFRARPDGRARLATTQRTRLTDLLPAWWLAVLAALSAIVSLVAWRDLQAWLGMTTTAVILGGGWVVTALGFAGASWLARSPQVAHQPSDLRWNDFRRADEVARLTAFVASLVVFVPWISRWFIADPAPLAAWALPLPLVPLVFSWLGPWLAARRHRARWASDEVAHAQR